MRNEKSTICFLRAFLSCRFSLALGCFLNFYNLLLRACEMVVLLPICVYLLIQFNKFFKEWVTLGVRARRVRCGECTQTQMYLAHTL